MKTSFSKEGFDALLGTLDADRNQAAEKYLRLREKLERFFEWRNCENVEDLADIVVDRTAKKIIAGEVIENPEAFCITVAKYVLLENRRSSFRTEPLEEDAPQHIDKPVKGENEFSELKFKCLDECLSGLPSKERTLITKYFDTDERTMIRTRKRLAKSQGITINSLRIRVSRLKTKLDVCLRNCCENA